MLKTKSCGSSQRHWNGYDTRGVQSFVSGVEPATTFQGFYNYVQCCCPQVPLRVALSGIASTSLTPAASLPYVLSSLPNLQSLAVVAGSCASGMLAFLPRKQLFGEDKELKWPCPNLDIMLLP